MTASYEGICVEDKRKKRNTTLVFLLWNCPEVVKTFL